MFLWKLNHNKWFIPPKQLQFYMGMIKHLLIHVIFVQCTGHVDGPAFAFSWFMTLRKYLNFTESQFLHSQWAPILLLSKFHLEVYKALHDLTFLQISNLSPVSPTLTSLSATFAVPRATEHNPSQESLLSVSSPDGTWPTSSLPSVCTQLCSYQGGLFSLS